MRRLKTKFTGLLPHGPLDALRQLSLFVVADLCYETVRGIAEGRKVEAFSNAASIIHVEEITHTFFEPGLQQALIGQRWLVDLANFSYMNTHFVLTSSFLVWLYIYRNEHFYFVRNMFMVAMGLALVGYTVLPTAPPRLFPEAGFVDTITQFAKVNHDSAAVQTFVNPYAAVPSMHCCFALLIGVPGAMLTKNRVGKTLWMIYPMFVFFVVIITANHFWLDGAAGALVATLSALAAREVLARARPAAWSWQPIAA